MGDACAPAGARRGCQPREKRDHPDGGKQREHCLEAGRGEHEAAKHGTNDLAEVRDCVQPAELQDQAGVRSTSICVVRASVLA